MLGSEKKHRSTTKQFCPSNHQKYVSSKNINDIKAFTNDKTLQPVYYEWAYKLQKYNYSNKVKSSITTCNTKGGIPHNNKIKILWILQCLSKIY